MIIRVVIISIYALVHVSTFAQTINIDNGYEKGASVDGYKAGVWEYFENDTLKLKLDYETGHVLYLAPDTSRYTIKTSSGWEKSKLDIYPAYVGSKREILKIIYENLNYPRKARQRNRQGTVLIGFEINKSGEAENFIVIKDIGFDSGEEVIKAFKKVPNIWLPAHKDGVKYRSRYILPVRFYIAKSIPKKGEKPPKQSKKEIKNINKAVADYLPSKYFEELVVTAFSVTRISR